MLPVEEDSWEKTLSFYRERVFLVEISQKALDEKRYATYPLEMQFAYEWAQKQGQEVFGFDVEFNTHKSPPATPREIQEIEEKQIVLLEGRHWQEANKKEIREDLQNLAKPLVDEVLFIKRQQQMLANILNYRDKNVVVFTGAGHLSFFAKHLQDVYLPFE